MFPSNNYFQQISKRLNKDENLMTSSTLLKPIKLTSNNTTIFSIYTIITINKHVQNYTCKSIDSIRNISSLKR